MSAVLHAGTREEWLVAAVAGLHPFFAEKGIALPNQIRASCGWPRSGSRGQGVAHVIGQCWARGASKDGSSEVFISPVLDDALQVAAVLVHELIHSIDDCRHGHRGPFRQMALAVGLEGPMRATYAGAALKERLNALVEVLGPYPHASLDPSQASGKQGTRLLKVVCDRSSCGYAVWTTRIWLDLGTPTCVCGGRMSEIARR